MDCRWIKPEALIGSPQSLYHTNHAQWLQAGSLKSSIRAYWEVDFHDAVLHPELHRRVVLCYCRFNSYPHVYYTWGYPSSPLEIHSKVLPKWTVKTDSLLALAGALFLIFYERFDCYRRDATVCFTRHGNSLNPVGVEHKQLRKMDILD